jgi:hypothetical protein
VRAAVHLAHRQTVSVGVLLGRKYFARNDVLHVLSEVGKFFHLEPAGEEFIFQLFGGNFYFNVFF